MTPTRKTKTIYWISTLLFLGPLMASGIAFTLAVSPAVEGMTHLGYPPYIVRFLGVAKILGVVAILSGRFPRIKEWAYAGFTFNLLGACYSHLCSGDGPKAISPLVILALAAVSYRQWNKMGSGGKTAEWSADLRQPA